MFSWSTRTRLDITFFLKKNSNMSFPSFQASSVKEIYLKKCPSQKAVVNGFIEAQLSSDGVSECRSNSVSLDVYSIRMMGCKQIYPLRIVRPIDKSFNNHDDHLKIVLDDLLDVFIKILHYIGDNPKRALARLCLNHASLFPCEYCFSKGLKHHINPNMFEMFRKKVELKKKMTEDKIKELKDSNGSESEIKALKNIMKELLDEEKNGPRKKTQTVWPASTMNAESRTDEKMLEIINEIEMNPALDKNERKGVVGRSPLWDIPGFKFTRDVPTEYMHLGCLGVVKRMVELTFSVGDNRKRITKRKLSSPLEFNILMMETKVTREFPRRARKLDFAVMKALEMRNLCLFFFPHILQCIEPNAKERTLWLELTFMLRSCTIPSDEFQPIDLSLLENVCKEFYTLYEALFGPHNCSYSTHVLPSHLIEMRVHGPLTLTSAFGFESFYGEMRNAFTPGTQSQLKQIMENVYIKRALSYHCCNNSIHYAAHDSPVECNTLVYCYEGNDFKMYKIIEVQQDSLICYKQGKFKFQFNETRHLHLNWSHVGVFKKGGVMNTPIVVPKAKVSGKVLHVGEYLITCPLNVLREK